LEPDRHTVAQVAELLGVSRTTVYGHRQTRPSSRIDAIGAGTGDLSRLDATKIVHRLLDGVDAACWSAQNDYLSLPERT
jgi:hypothetical protein